MKNYHVGHKKNEKLSKERKYINARKRNTQNSNKRNLFVIKVELDLVPLNNNLDSSLAD